MESVELTTRSKIFVAGHRGLVGSAVVRRLSVEGYRNLVTRSRQELDLSLQAPVMDFMKEERPDFVVLAAARVGGILANDTYRGDFIRENLQIQNNVIDAAFRSGVKRLLFLGSSCIYPRDCPQPIKEEYLLTGPLEETNRPYAIAKIAGIEMCDALNRQYGTAYQSIMPTNLYGPEDNFDLKTSHVLPALLRRFHEGKQQGLDHVTIWGSGKPKREFLHVDDLADACVFLLKKSDNTELLNVGTGQDLSILELAQGIAEVVGFQGKIELDTEKPDGTPRKLLDVSRLERLGWKARTSLSEGLRQTYDWYLKNVAES